jgi:uncharacterized protein (DUF58 family)
MRPLDLQDFSRFSHLELLARQVVEGFITGLHRSPFHGFSVEFAEHRQYNTGESTRHIDWKLYARTEKLFVKRYEEETNLRCHIILDISSSMHFPLKKDSIRNIPNKISFSVMASAAIIEMMRKQRDAFGVTAFSSGIDWHTPDRSSVSHQKYIYHELNKLMDEPKMTETKKTATAPMLHQIAEMIHKRSLVIIFSDMFQNTEGDNDKTIDDIFSALQHIKHNKHEILLFHVTDEKLELEFDFDNRPYRFIDLETQQEIKLFPSEIREKYRSAVSEYEKKLKMKCTQLGIDFVAADIEKGFEQVLWNYLIKRNKQH